MTISLSIVPLVLGLCVAYFILPVSLIGALSGFAAVQLIHALRKGKPSCDRFREGLRTAQRVLDENAF